jgi:hypothetical protein
MMRRKKGGGEAGVSEEQAEDKEGMQITPCRRAGRQSPCLAAKTPILKDEPERGGSIDSGPAD